MKEQNNIFHYATSELSQDAFLCWLFSYALKDADNDAALNACAIDFLKQFIILLKTLMIYGSVKSQKGSTKIQIYF